MNALRLRRSRQVFNGHHENRESYLTTTIRFVVTKLPDVSR
jgi:hypothetical protein